MEHLVVSLLWDSKDIQEKKSTHRQTASNVLNTNLPSMSYEGLMNVVKFIGSTPKHQ